VLLALFAGKAHATLITVEPDDFTAGRYISFATSGVRLSTMTVTFAGMNEHGSPVYAPVYGPVFAQEVSSICVTTHCAATGSKVFSHTYDPDPGAIALWGEAHHAGEYLFGGPSDWVSRFRNALRVDFDRATDYVDILGQFFAGDGTWLEAFNSSGESLGTCYGYPWASNPCASAFSVFGSANEGWARYSITRASTDIAFIIAGGAANYRALDQLRFAVVSEPGPLAILCAGLIAVALRRAVVRKT
jgi:hypothetical protein